jgi:hypothetical protein
VLNVKYNGIEVSYPGSGKDQLKQLLTILYKTRRLKPAADITAETNCSVYKVKIIKNKITLEETNE